MKGYYFLFLEVEDERRKAFKMLVVTLVLLAAIIVVAKEKVYVLKYSWISPLEPFEQCSGAYATVFKNELERLSGGKIKVELYPSAQLGDQRASIELLVQGMIQGADVASGVFASLMYPPLEIVDMPFLFSSYEVAYLALGPYTNPFMKKLVEDCAKKTGVRILNILPFGFRHILNSKRPIRTPDDLKGLKIRTMEIVPHIKMMEALGATPVPIPWTELYTSLQTGVVDGFENTPQNILQGKFYQIQKYLTLTGHVMGVGAILISEKWFQSLPDELKVAVIDAGRAAAKAYVGITLIQDALGIQELKAKGMNVYAPTPGELKQFKDRAVPAVKAYMEERLGSDFVNEFLNSIEEIKQKMAELAK
ncbi:MAG: TRAP-type transport system periplasmic protein [Thermotogota bacterium]|nr:TRAP-type transport system periplasmic protein [Thermotogota bacterium]